MSVQPFYGEGAAFRDMAGQIRRGYDVECPRCGEFCDTGSGPCKENEDERPSDV